MGCQSSSGPCAGMYGLTHSLHHPWGQKKSTDKDNSLTVDSGRNCLGMGWKSLMAEWLEQAS